MKLPASLAIIKTPAGAASSSAGMLSLIVNVILPPVWPWLAHQSPSWRGGVLTVLIFAAAYAGAAAKVGSAAGKKLTLGLRPGRLPVVRAVPQEEKPPAGP